MDSSVLPAGSEALFPMGRIGRTPMIGRRRELAEALADLSRVRAGEGRVLLVSGEPGVGKTRFAREIAAQMQAVGGVTLSSECYAEGDVPYDPFARMVRESIPLGVL